MRYNRYVTSQDGLAIHARPLEEDDPFGETDTCKCAEAKQRSQLGPGAAAWLRARLVDPSRVIPAYAFLYAGRRYLGIKERLAATCPDCGAAYSNARQANLCPRAGAQVNQHQPLIRTTSLFRKRISICHQVESGSPFDADRDLRMDTGGGGFETQRHPISGTKHAHQRHVRGPPSGDKTCVPEALTKMGQPLPLLRRESATNPAGLGHSAFDKRSPKPVTTVVRWKALDVLQGEKANESIF